MYGIKIRSLLEFAKNFYKFLEIQQTLSKFMRYFTFCNFVKMTELWKNGALRAKEKIFSKNLKKFEKNF